MHSGQGVGPFNQAIETARIQQIGNRRVVVVDNLFGPGDVEALYEFLNSVPYYLDDHDGIDEVKYARHWKAEFPVPMALGTPIFRTCIDLTRELLAPQALDLKRAHANLHLYDDMQHPHHDIPGGVSAVYYANARWDNVWGGETVFFDESGDAVHIVAPRPGRLVVFDADIIHRAGVPTRTCFEPRISVAFKFKRR